MLSIVITSPLAISAAETSVTWSIVNAHIRAIPITFFSFDEQSGLDGIKTRLEAFYDLLNFKREG